MEKRFICTFANQQAVYAIQVHRIGKLRYALDELDIQYPHPTLVLVGGASGISNDDFVQIRRLFIEVLAPLAESLNLAVVDGGTDAGLMRLMGQARFEINGTFPLIGVAAIGTIDIPDAVHVGAERISLEPHHSHFVLVPGSKWGNEARWIAQLATVLADRHPSVTVLINGGEIAWKDVAESVKAKRPVIVVAGSGRTADTLTAALHGDVVIDKRSRRLVASGWLQTITPSENLNELFNVLQKTYRHY